jgi:hypothetical protein
VQITAPHPHCRGPHHIAFRKEISLDLCMSNKELQCIDSLSVCCTADRGPSDAAETQQHEDFVSRIEGFIKKLSFFGPKG